MTEAKLRAGGARERGALLLSVVVLVALIRIICGGLGESKALLISALFSLECSTALIVAVASRWSGRSRLRKSSRHDMGKVVLLVLGGMSLVIVLGVAGFCLSVLHTMLEHQPLVPAEEALWGAVAAAVVASVILGASDRLAGEAAGLVPGLPRDRSREELWASIAVVTAVVLARFVHPMIDPVVALMLAASTSWHAGLTIRGVLRGLMDASVERGELRRLEEVVRQVEGVLGVRSLRARRSGTTVVAVIEVVVPGDWSMEEAEETRARIRAALSGRGSEVGELKIGLCPADEVVVARCAEEGFVDASCTSRA